jgi:hypothetical protein
MVDIDKLLQERRKVHGDFLYRASITQGFKEIAYNSLNWDRLNDAQREAIEMILHKLGRILAGDPDHCDHWDDICGYARLASACTPNSSAITKADPSST